ncbi:hypothetical protein AAFF_G00439660 [Aldrovandia affinis]|uniref:IF rod domain-containing protein n=1 Tax=Aldrovandia affinis TaxID=143900 RepID=A0AAD7S815_9TELE|nr:hypothetical protein AAFF_G00439660 [Aldrovandia affinis]
MSYSINSSRVLGGSFGGTYGGLSLTRGGGMGARMGLGGGASLGLGLGGGVGGGLAYGVVGGGSGYGLGLGMGGMGMGGLGMGGMGMGGLGMGGMGMGGGGGGMLIASPAFAMGRTIAAGGLSGGSALAIGPALAPAFGPILSREAEKITLSGLNDRFSTYMAKVRVLQQENLTLEARLCQLTGGTDVSPESSTSTAEYEAQLGEYRITLEGLTLDTIKLEIELDNIRGTAHEVKAKFDFEQGVKFQLEADIAAMKKDIDMASDLRIDLDAKYSSLKNELDFVTKTQEEELSGLQSKLGTTSMETSVSMIEVDTDKSFDISSALNKMRAEYQKSVQQHKEEADAYYKLKFDEIQTATEKSTEAITSAKMEIGASKKELQALSLELQSLVTVHLTLEHSLAEAQAQSTVGVAEYQNQMSSLATAIEVAKSDLHKQILSYQELLDIKLALDVEISTYRKLLEGNDFAISDGFGGTSFSFSAGSGGMHVKEIISAHTETSLISESP